MFGWNLIKLVDEERENYKIDVTLTAKPDPQIEKAIPPEEVE